MVNRTAAMTRRRPPPTIDERLTAVARSQGSFELHAAGALSEHDGNIKEIRLVLTALVQWHQLHGRRHWWQLWRPPALIITPLPADPPAESRIE